MYTASALFDIPVPFFVFAPPNENTFRRPWYMYIGIFCYWVMVLSDGMVHFLKIKKKKLTNLLKLSCGFKTFIGFALSVSGQSLYAFKFGTSSVDIAVIGNEKMSAFPQIQCMLIPLTDCKLHKRCPRYGKNPAFDLDTLSANPWISFNAHVRYSQKETPGLFSWEFSCNQLAHRESIACTWLFPNSQLNSPIG